MLLLLPVVDLHSWSSSTRTPDRSAHWDCWQNSDFLFFRISIDLSTSLWTLVTVMRFFEAMVTHIRCQRTLDISFTPPQKTSIYFWLKVSRIMENCHPRTAIVVHHLLVTRSGPVGSDQLDPETLVYTDSHIPQVGTEFPERTGENHRALILFMMIFIIDNCRTGSCCNYGWG